MDTEQSIIVLTFTFCLCSIPILGIALISWGRKHFTFSLEERQLLNGAALLLFCLYLGMQSLWGYLLYILLK